MVDAISEMLISAKFRDKKKIANLRVQRYSGFVFKPENHVQHVFAGRSDVAR